MLEDKIPVLILAGGKKKFSLVETVRQGITNLVYGERFLTYDTFKIYKSLMLVNKKPMMQYPINNFNSYEKTTGEIYVVGPDEIKKSKVSGYKKLVRQGNSLGETLFLGVDSILADYGYREMNIYISTCDIVRGTPSAIRDFEKSCENITDYTLILSFIDKKFIKQKGIFGWRPSLGCEEGSFRISNFSKLHITKDLAGIVRNGAAYFRNKIIEIEDKTATRMKEEIDSLYNTRRWLNPINWPYLINYFSSEAHLVKKFLKRELSIHDLEDAANRNISKFLHDIYVKIRFAMITRPELAEDIDSLTDWRAMRKPKPWDYARLALEAGVAGASLVSAYYNYDDLRILAPSLMFGLYFSRLAKKDAAMLYRAGKLSNPSD